MININDIAVIKERIMPEAKILGIPLDYSESSLVKLQDRINEMFPEGHNILDSTLVVFGILFGETIVKSIPNAKWDFETVEYLDDMKITVKAKHGEFCIFPCVRVIKFLKDRSDSLVSILNMMRFMQKHTFDEIKKMTDSAGWVHDGDNHYRMTFSKIASD